MISVIKSIARVGGSVLKPAIRTPVQSNNIVRNVPKITPGLSLYSTSATTEMKPELKTGHQPMPNFKNYVIRPAQVEDCGTILHMIKGLAAALHHGDGVELTEQDLARDGFGSQPLYHCLLAENLTSQALQSDPEKYLGFAIYYYIYSTWQGISINLEDLYVTEAAQGLGVGNGLMKSVAQMGIVKGCKRMQWIVDGSTPAVKFYKRQGSVDTTVEDNWHLMRMYDDVLTQYATDEYMSTKSKL